MDLAIQYCPTRRDLEEHCWNLVSRLCESTTHLMTFVGRDHGAFLAAKSECQETREDLAGSGQKLRQHRVAHGC